MWKPWKLIQVKLNQFTIFKTLSIKIIDYSENRFNGNPDINTVIHNNTTNVHTATDQSVISKWFSAVPRHSTQEAWDTGPQWQDAAVEKPCSSWWNTV